ncbi:thiamine-binding protein [Spirochaeta cellobiosiphila]|uniref:thiamine-binding protein n=1 Tax=Spirochaeta cellobiosiphila TaxID=504483 RepID=UPI000406653A|nr:thiamine-binding protein [Spirochaeta cellobiosiphila]
MPIINLSLQILPTTEVSQIYPTVDKVIDLIKSSGVKYVVGPMETTMEGDMDVLFDIAKQAHYICSQAGADSVVAIIKTHYRPGSDVTMEEKIGKYH